MGFVFGWACGEVLVAEGDAVIFVPGADHGDVIKVADIVGF